MIQLLPTTPYPLRSWASRMPRPAIRQIRQNVIALPSRSVPVGPPIQAYSPDEERDETGKWTSGDEHKATDEETIDRRRWSQDMPVPKTVAGAITLFHGTASAMIASIKENGLQ